MFIRPIQNLGDSGIYILQDLGRMAIYLVHALLAVFKRPFRLAECLRQIHFVGTGSLVVIFFYRRLDGYGTWSSGLLFSP